VSWESHKPCELKRAGKQLVDWWGGHKRKKEKRGVLGIKKPSGRKRKKRRGE